MAFRIILIILPKYEIVGMEIQATVTEVQTPPQHTHTHKYTHTLWYGPLTNYLHDTLLQNWQCQEFRDKNLENGINASHSQYETPPEGRTYLVVILVVRSWGQRRVRAGSTEEPAGALQEVTASVQLPDQPSQPRENQSGEEAKSSICV